ncbi:vacuolar protein [Aspergillus ochraceoroseus]|uniref:Vacuolar protein sorting-associated protein 29 n=1 Tax=Aspergillus ochraceoroseus TaxID=138278 RepID=A0A0F8U242_9EURO|nr:vacuolar protein [Aspergillus ochraceoroseus]
MTSRLVLVIGDLFIPDRAPVCDFTAPPKHKLYLALANLLFSGSPGQGKIGQILCLGNLTDRNTFEFLRGVAPDLQLVKGDFDVDSTNLPLSKVVTHGSLRIGFTHGHTIIPPGDADALLIAARQMDVDILLWGGTHRFEAFEMEGRFFVNPGSATGALSTGYWPEGEDPTPSFCLMDIQGDVLVLYVYQLKTDANGAETVAVEKVSYRKNNPSS